MRLGHGAARHPRRLRCAAVLMRAACVQGLPATSGILIGATTGQATPPLLLTPACGSPIGSACATTKSNPSPPPASTNATACAPRGTYQLVANGRAHCAPGAHEYLVYFGGSRANCASTDAVLRRAGAFAKKRAHWKVAPSAAVARASAISTAGRGCSGGEKGLGGGAPAGNVGVSLARQSSAWVLKPVRGSCATVNVVHAGRAARGKPSVLSAPTACDSHNVFLAAKDQGTGRQQWTLKKVA